MPKKRPTVLIAETLESSREELEAALARHPHKFKVLTASDGKEALKVFKKNKVDLLLTTVLMPEMDGFQLIEKITKLGKLPQMIMVTSSNIEQFIINALTHDIGHIIHKPCDEKDLHLLIDKLMFGHPLFGLENTLIGCDIQYRQEVRESLEMDQVRDDLVALFGGEGMDSKVISHFKLALTEMLSNAIYHAHGYRKEKMRREKIKLKDHQRVEVVAGATEGAIGLSVTDSAGALEKRDITKAFKDTIVNEWEINEMLQKGENPVKLLRTHGRGLNMTKRLAQQFVINLEKGVRTEMVVVFNKEKINEVYNTELRIFQA